MIHCGISHNIHQWLGPTLSCSSALRCWEIVRRIVSRLSWGSSCVLLLLCTHTPLEAPLVSRSSIGLHTSCNNDATNRHRNVRKTKNETTYGAHARHNSMVYPTCIRPSAARLFLLLCTMFRIPFNMLSGCLHNTCDCLMFLDVLCCWVSILSIFVFM